MSESELKLNPNQEQFITSFKGLAIGEVLRMPLSVLIPTQPPDGRYSRTRSPVEAFIDNGRVVILHGNHRYFDAKEVQAELIEVRRVSNPYIEY